MPVWPGDQPYDPKWSARVEDGSSVNVGAVTMSLHAGTHADAPLHVAGGGRAMEQLSLEPFIGPAVVVEAIGRGELPASVVDGVDFARTPRVLLKTRREAPPAEWSDEFAFLSVALARKLAHAGALLVGLDTPSVDHPQSTSLDAHHALFGAAIANLENLRLDHVQPGEYVLLAAPVVLEGMDAGPVRAVLVEPSDLRTYSRLM